jgi:hypothetical protein
LRSLLVLLFNYITARALISGHGSCMTKKTDLDFLFTFFSFDSLMRDFGLS